MYDAAGNVLSASDRLGDTTTYQYDNRYRLVSQADALGNVTSFTYDGAGNLLTLTDAEQNTTTWAYDDLNRVVEETNELDDTCYFAYDAVGNLTGKTDRNERVTEYVYDNLYRRTAENWKDGASTVHAFSYTYDAAGRLLTASDPSADYEYDYDALDRLIEETQTIDGLAPVVVLASQYDADSRLTQLAATIGVTEDYLTDYSYDNIGRLTSIQQQDNGGNAVAEKRVDYTYDAAGQWATISRYADLAATDLVATGAYGYDSAGRLTDLTYTKGTTLVDYDWSFDAADRMTQYVNSIDGTVDYTNDATGQLTGADYDYQTDESYVYDDNGNRVTANSDTYVTGAGNQLLSDDTYRYAYDDEGNRTLKFIDTDSSGTLNSGDTDITEYEWDYRSRLTSVEHFTTYANYDAGTSDQLVTYVYDVFNRLVGRTLDPDGTSGSTDIEQSIFVHDDNQIALQFDKTGTGDLAAGDLSHRYLWGQAVDQILADETVDDGGAEDVLWTLTDHLNTVRDLASYNPGTDTTTIENHRVYDAFGNLESETNAAVDCVFSYTGRLFDEDTGLQNNLNRWYDAEVGRWLSEDPIGFEGGDENLYRYCINSTTIYIDPTGYVVKAYLSPVKISRRGGPTVGYHVTIIAGDDGHYVQYNGGGERTAINGVPQPRREKAKGIPDGSYDIISPYKTGADDIAALDKAKASFKQLPYKRLGPNSNTYAHELLDRAGMRVPKYTKIEYHPGPGIHYPSRVTAGPAATIGWDNSCYKKSGTKSCVGQ